MQASCRQQQQLQQQWAGISAQPSVPRCRQQHCWRARQQGYTSSNHSSSMVQVSKQSNLAPHMHCLLLTFWPASNRQKSLCRTLHPDFCRTVRAAKL
jgi:hypothetical protein